MDKELEKQIKSPLFPWWFWVLALGICLIWFFGPEIVEWRGGKTKPSNAGEFGDLFGVINALFSGLAFLGVLVGIFIQGREFRLQLKEMAESSQEMKKQTNAYEKQIKVLQVQTDILKRQLGEAQIQGRMEALPFLISRVTVSSKVINFALRNSGAEVFGLKCVSDLPDSPTYVRAIMHADAQEHTFEFSTMHCGRPSKVKFAVSYTTRLGHQQLEEFIFSDPYAVDVFSYSDVAKLSAAIRCEIENSNV
ncbi:MAG: hypothetical protein ACK5TH_23255 [Prosthecobacter sp.]|jgi:hypothetical protein